MRYQQEIRLHEKLEREIFWQSNKRSRGEMLKAETGEGRYSIMIYDAANKQVSDNVPSLMYR